MALNTAKRPRGRLSMTSLIDVIFLLLLFFMLSSTFTKYGEIELLGVASGSTGGDTPEILFLSLGTDRVLLNGTVLEASDLPERLRQQSDDAQRIVLVSLDTDVTSQRLMDMLAILRGITGLRTSVLG